MAPADVEQIHHIARLAILAMCARGVAGAEFEASDEVHTVRLTVSRPVEGEQAAIDLEFFGLSSVPIGGVAL
ncbi:MAG: hypothetical protein Q7K20_01045 [Polaromonas sp.]|nr:hypothetical protein [Polaromonas sp.]